MSLTAEVSDASDESTCDDHLTQRQPSRKSSENEEFVARWSHVGQLPVLQSLLFSNESAVETSDGRSPVTAAAATATVAATSQQNVFGDQTQMHPVLCDQYVEPTSMPGGEEQSTYFVPNWTGDYQKQPETSNAGYYYDHGKLDDDASLSQKLAYSCADSASNSSACANAAEERQFSGSPDDKDFQQRKSASDRERSRMKDMNKAFDALRAKLVNRKPPGKRLSKIQALKHAIQHIAELEDKLNMGCNSDSDTSYDTYYYWAQDKSYSYAKEKTHMGNALMEPNTYVPYDHGGQLMSHQQPMQSLSNMKTEMFVDEETLNGAYAHNRRYDQNVAYGQYYDLRLPE